MWNQENEKKPFYPQDEVQGDYKSDAPGYHALSLKLKKRRMIIRIIASIAGVVLFAIISFWLINKFF